MQEALDRFMDLPGALGACIVDVNSGMMLASASASSGGNGLNLELAAAGSTDVLRAQRRALDALSSPDRVEDILISVPQQFHLLRPIERSDALYLYAIIDRERGNLAMARHNLGKLESEVEVL